jgi:hypothetical protein
VAGSEQQSSHAWSPGASYASDFTLRSFVLQRSRITQDDKRANNLRTILSRNEKLLTKTAVVAKHSKKNLATGGGAGLCCGGFCAADFLYAESFQDVADFYVVEIGDADAAFETGTDFAGVVLKAFERA